MWVGMRGRVAKSGRARVSLGWTRDGCLRLRADGFEPPRAAETLIPPESADFWRQQHVELRYLLDPADAQRQVQIIVTPRGAWWDSEGWWRDGGRKAGVRVRSAAGRDVTVRLPLAAAGLPAAPAGSVLHGLISHVKWDGEVPDLACSSPVDLGFNQAERFGEFLFAEGGAPPIALEAVEDGGVRLANRTDRACRGHLQVRREAPGDDATRAYAVLLRPGLTRVRCGLPASPWTFARFSFAWEPEDGLCSELGAVTRRAPLPALRLVRRPHPNLHFDAAGLGALRAKRRLPFFRKALAGVRVMPADVSGDLGATRRGVGSKGGSGFRMDLAMRPGDLYAKWLVTGDDRLIAAATRAVRAALRVTVFGREVHLHEGMAAGGLARAYDAFRPRLSPVARGDWKALLRLLLRLYIETARRASWTVTTIANANPVGNGGCGLAALALHDEEPRLAREAIRWAREYIWNWLDYCHGPDGGNTEGAQYWSYGMENFLGFATALERATGSDHGLLSHPAVTRAMNMVRLGLTNDGGMSGVNDTIPTPVGGAIGWFAAGRHGDALGLWYGDHAWRWLAARRAAGRPAPYAAGPGSLLLWRPALPEATRPPAFPRAFRLPETETAIARSASRFDARWVAGLKGSRPPYTHHNQADTGALFVDLRGERMVLDPGYYKPEATDHSLPLVGGSGPAVPTAAVGRILACEARGPMVCLALDATAAYAGRAKRVVRHMVLAGDEGIVLLDDIAAAGRVTTQFQCGGVTALLRSGRGVTVKGQRARMRIEWATRPDAVVRLTPERSLHDTHWGYHFADCRLFPVTLTYVARATEPLAVVFTDATRTTPRLCRVDRGADSLAVLLPSGRRVLFARRGGRWQMG
jgi:hypothetical protein